VERNPLVNECVRDGLLLGLITGAASGTAAAPVIGTIIGAIAGVVFAIPVALILAGVIGAAARPPGTAGTVRRRIDVTFGVFALLVALLAVGWISLEPLVGAAPAITMLVVIVLGLLLVRMRLRRLIAAPAG
jgi:hypothetical protein